MTTQMSRDEMLALLAQMQAENATLKAKMLRKTTITCKVSAKGAVSVYGLGRWPVTLYRTQWERLLASAKDIGEFITENANLLANKED